MRSLFRRKRQTFKAGPSPVAEARSDKPDLRARRAFLAEHVLVHTHIPKTGGSTLSNGLAGIVGSVHTMDLRLKRRVMPDEMAAEDLDDIRLLTGHMRYGQHPGFARTPLYFAGVRDPVERAVSNYRFLLSHTDHPDHPIVAGRDFETAWDAQAEHMGASFYNLQSQFIAGTRRGDEVDTRMLWERLEEDYFLVSPVSEMSNAVQAIRAAFGVPWARIPKLNVSRGNETDVSPQMREKILQTNALDAELYQHVTNSFDRRLQNACEYIASRCLLPLKDASTENEDRT